MLANDAIDFMITGEPAKLMMAEPTFRALELPALFDDGYHLRLPDFHPPHMGYRAWFRKCHFQVTPEINRALRVKGFLVLGVTRV